jgi:hypothetical protein
MPMHLVKHGSDTKQETPVASKKEHIIVRHDWCGVVLSPEDFQKFQEIVNQRRPYCSKDFIPQTFIPNLSKVRY